MKSLTSRFKILLLGSVLGLFINSGVSLAAATPVAGMNDLNLKFRLISFDTRTNGKVTATTKQIGFGILVSNDSPYYISAVAVQIPTLCLSVLNSVGCQAISQVSEPNSIEAAQNVTEVQPFSSNYMRSKRTIDVPSGFSLNQPIIGTAKLNMRIIPKDDSATSLSFQSQIEDMLYVPSNDELIPQIIRNQTTASDMLTAIGNTVAKIWNRVSR